MSSSMDGLSSLYSITAQIKALQEAQNSKSGSVPDAAATQEIILSFEQRLNDMVSQLGSESKEDSSSDSDPFTDFFNTYKQTSTTTTSTNSANATTNTSDTSQQASLKNTVLGSASLVNPYSGSLNANALGIQNLYGDSLWKNL